MKGRAAGLAVLGVLAFVVLDVVAVLLAEDSYSARQDYVSSLAGRGSSVWVLEVAGLGLFAAAHVALGLVLVRTWRVRVAGAVVVLSGLLMLVVTFARVGCPQGEAGCALTGNYDNDTISAVHGISAGLYMLAMLLAMLFAAISSYAAQGARRWILLAALPLAVFAFYALIQMEAEGANGDTGLWERLWLGANAVWILLAGGVPASSRVAAPRVSAEV